jgi:hypothetical protein
MNLFTCELQNPINHWDLNEIYVMPKVKEKKRKKRKKKEKKSFSLCS